MENFLDYLLYSLFGHNVTSVQKRVGPCGKVWEFQLEGHVYFCLDEYDLAVIRSLYERHKGRFDDDVRARYMKIFNSCV